MYRYNAIDMLFVILKNDVFKSQKHINIITFRILKKRILYEIILKVKKPAKLSKRQSITCKQ